MKVIDFGQRKKQQKKISMVTCYDFWSAQIIEESEIDCVLVGDSVAMIMHGFSNTIPATTKMIASHVESVCRGAPNKFIVADMPFLSVRAGIADAVRAVDTLLKAGAQAVKIEGIEGHKEIIQHIVQSGVPVMGHLGLTPQSIHQLSGFRVQGKQDSEAKRLLAHAQEVESAGCFAVVLECIPSSVASDITSNLTIPTIGIGAGSGTDGQVLVLHDLLDFTGKFQAKFLRKYLKGRELILQALNQYDGDVKSRRFPTDEESYQ
jgi:3-methyl-2-oxobutanoate hydroxymethyltransferase